MPRDNAHRQLLSSSCLSAGTECDRPHRDGHDFGAIQGCLRLDMALQPALELHQFFMDGAFATPPITLSRNIPASAISTQRLVVLFGLA